MQMAHMMIMRIMTIGNKKTGTVHVWVYSAFFILDVLSQLYPYESVAGKAHQMWEYYAGV